jgi:hypothetical protein
MRFDRFFHQNAIRTTIRVARVMLNDAPTRTLFINLKPRCGLAGGGESPLSEKGAPCP